MSGEKPITRSLGARAARGVVTLGMAGMVEQGSQFVRAIVLAHLLTPSDFGLMGMAFIAIRAGDMLSQTGFSRALVQKKGDAVSYLDTVFVVSVVRGFALFSIAWLVAPLVGSFFGTQEVTPLLRFVALAMIIQGFINPGLFLLERELKFKRQASPAVAGAVFDLAVAISLAVYLRSVWAMAIGFVAGKTVFVIASYVVRPYRPGLGVKRDQVAEFYLFGKHIFRSSVVDYVVSQMDRLIIGRLLGADALGLYSVAWRVASLPATAIYGIVLRVAFPLFSRIQEEASRLRSGFLKALGLMATVAAPIAAGLWAVAPEFVPVVLGSRWASVIPTFRILCLVGVALSLNYLTRGILSAVGRPELGARSAYIFISVMAIPIYPAIATFGVIGAAWCLGLAAVVALAFLLYTSSKVLGCRIAESLKTLMMPMAAAVLMSLGVVGIGGVLHGLAPWILLVAKVATGLALYPLLLVLLDKLSGGRVISALKASLRSA